MHETGPVAVAVCDRELTGALAWTRAALGRYWLLASMLARPVAQKWDGTMISTSRPSPGPENAAS